MSIPRQTFVISVNLNTMTGDIPSRVQLPMNLRFPANELILKSISYANPDGLAHPDVPDVIQISCNVTNDNLIGSFPNSGFNSFPVFSSLENHLSISNTFQTGNLVLEFQATDGSLSSCNPQALVSSQAPQRTFGTVVLTIEFVKNPK